MSGWSRINDSHIQDGKVPAHPLVWLARYIRVLMAPVAMAGCTHHTRKKQENFSVCPASGAMAVMNEWPPELDGTTMRFCVALWCW
jgi:hypothetical protein